MRIIELSGRKWLVIIIVVKGSKVLVDVTQMRSAENGRESFVYNNSNHVQ